MVFNVMSASYILRALLLWYAHRGWKHEHRFNNDHHVKQERDEVLIQL